MKKKYNVLAPPKAKRPRLRNVEKVAAAIGGELGRFSDNSASWVLLEDAKNSICITFDGKGEKFQHIIVSEKIYQVVEEKTLAKILSPE